jgi:hypothetical protein
VTVDERWRRFRASFEAALAEQLDGRPAAFKALWSHRPDVSIFGALAGFELGWAEVEALLDWVSERVRAIDRFMGELPHNATGKLLKYLLPRN